MEISHTIFMALFLISIFLNISLIVYSLYSRKRYASQNNSSNLPGLRLEDLVDQLPCHVYWKDFRGTLVGGNALNRADFGFPNKKDFQILTDYQILTKDQADKVTLFDKEVIRTGNTIINEEQLTNADGSLRTYLSYKTPLKDSSGNMVGLAGISVDVTQANREIAQKLKMLEDIIAAMPGNVYWVNRDGRYLGCNDNQAKHVGLKNRYDIINKTNANLPEFSDSDKLEKTNEEVMRAGHHIVTEETALFRDGTEAIYLSNKVPLRDDHGNVVGLVGISIDITDRKKQEEDLKKAKEKAEEATVLKNDFIKNIEHDLRTPFTGILGIAEMIWKEETDPEKKEMLGYIVSSAKQLLDYHNNVLEFSKVIAGNFPVLCKKMDIKKLVTHIVDIEKPAAVQKNLDFTMEFDETIPSVLMSDEYRVSRILLNLISNAIKFTIKGSIHFSVKAQVIKDKTIVLDFMIKDTGMGIPLDKQQYIFEQFTRLTPANEGLYFGLGIGLKIVKEFTRDLSGNIDLLSHANQGTSFTISLPFEIPLTQIL
jgi:two-component system aerobic respiration control sensor histidine kinase ArcB